MLNTFEVNKVLIIAPLRVARDTWPAEIEKWDHLKGLDISVIVGDVKTRIAAVHHPAMIYIVNRENIKWLVEYYEKNGMRWDFGMVVIDELSSFKNYQSQRFKYLRKVRPFVKRWVGLTGTPSSNGPMDLWAEIGILDGGERLGKFIGRYREAYFKAGSMNPATGVVFQYKPREGAEEMIYQRISDITISMKALDYLNMPDCVPTRYEVEMNTEERKLYDMLRQDLLIPLKDGDIDAANAASLTGKLLQMSNGAVYDENGKARSIHDHKLEALEDLIEAANGQPVLVAYWFKHDRQRIIEHLTHLKIPVRDIKSSTDIKDWNAGNIPVGSDVRAGMECDLYVQIRCESGQGAGSMVRKGWRCQRMSAMTISEKSAVSENIDCYENLANAIVLQAVKDYKAALHTLEDYPESSFAKHEIVVQEKFFHSQWFGILTDLDPERLILGVKERVKIEAVERRRKKAERLRRKNEKDMKQLLWLLTDAGAELIPEKIRELKFL